MTNCSVSGLIVITGFTSFSIHAIAQYESTLIKFANAEVQIEDLKVQLDDALGAEEMLVQLTERNLMLGEVTLSPYKAIHYLLMYWALRKSRRCGLLSKIWKR